MGELSTDTCTQQLGDYMKLRGSIKKLQLPKHERGLDVTLRVTRCAGHVSANTRPHQLRWGDSGSVGTTWHAHAI